MEDARSRLRATFDTAALLYDEVRPGYPEALFDDVVSLSGIPPGGRILEIGCGTGQATAPFARRGYRILCIELGENMAALARHNLAAYPWAEVVTSAFEEWPAEEGAFDLVVSATAFHWIEPDVAYRKIADSLKPGGALALFWNVYVRSDRDAGFFEAVQEAYLRETPDTAGDHTLPGPGEVADTPGGIGETGLFGEVATRRYLWHQEYDAESYVRLLGTYSDHLALDPPVRERLFRGIADLINERYGGRITKGYVAILYVAHRK